MTWRAISVWPCFAVCGEWLQHEDAVLAHEVVAVSRDRSRRSDDAVRACTQGIPLVHFSAQPKPFLPHRIHPKLPLNTPYPTKSA